jgi:hypothetical protein
VSKKGKSQWDDGRRLRGNSKGIVVEIVELPGYGSDMAKFMQSVMRVDEERMDCEIAE